MPKKHKARLVMNHSSRIPGIRKVLKKLASEKRISTIIMGRVFKSFSDTNKYGIPCGKKGKYRVRVSRATRGGWSLIFRLGGMGQVVYVTTTMDDKELNKVLSSPA